MAKKTSERGIKQIAIREGEILHGYKDSKGLLTVGVGHLVKSGEPYKLRQPITLAESRRLLAIDLKEAEDAVNSLGIELLQNEFDALVSLTFNIGVGGFKRSSVAKRLKAHAPRQSVAQAILLWNKPKEIQRRRRTEYDQFLTPYPASATSQPTQQPSQLAAESDKSNSTTSDTADTTLPTNDATSTTTEQTVVATNTGETAVSTTTQESQNVVIESREEKGFFASIWKKITGLSIFNGGVSALSDGAQQVQAFGLSHEFWERVIYLAVGASLIYLAYEGYSHWSRIHEAKERDRLLASVNSTPTNTVEFASSENLDKLESLGYKVIRRK